MPVQIQLLSQGDALLSPCGTYRYSLTRRWNYGRPSVVFVMLNPSTADADQDDPTIRRCIGFARSWGFGGIEVGNLFALRSTDPSLLVSHPDPVGPDNDAALLTMAMMSGCVVAAWGAHSMARERAHVVTHLLREGGMWCLGVTKDGCPRHPLYVPKEQEMVPFPPAA